jgi:hypothetical protein
MSPEDGAMLPIDLFTPEEQAQIPAFKEKWRKIALSTDRIDRAQAEASIRLVYKTMGKCAPKIICCNSPLEAAASLVEQVQVPPPPWFLGLSEQSVTADGELSRSTSAPTLSYLLRGLIYGVLFTRKIKAVQKNPLSDLATGKHTVRAAYKQFAKQAERQFVRQNFTMADFLESAFAQIPETHRELDQAQAFDTAKTAAIQPVATKWYGKIFNKIGLFFVKNHFISQALAQISEARWGGIDRVQTPMIMQRLPEVLQLVYTLSPTESAISGNTLDFCNTVISPLKQAKKWQALQSVYTQCGWIFIAEGVCYICDRPTQLKLDDEYRPHAEGEAAIEYSDGTKIYAYRGALLPEQYGQTLPSQWQAAWLLTETNAEIRRALIQGIGYDRLCQDLDAIELDTWAEYTLLKVKDSIDVEDLHLLKMTCPSTGHIHAMRVPPEVTSAREAIKWMNWDIDPAEFAVQT